MVTSEPVAHSIAQDGAADRGCGRPPGIQRIEPDQHPANKDDGTAWDHCADHRQRLEQGRSEDRPQRQARVCRKILDQRLQMRFHVLPI